LITGREGVESGLYLIKLTSKAELRAKEEKNRDVYMVLIVILEQETNFNHQWCRRE